MAVDERRRSELFERLAAALGPDQAATMFELLPPAGADLATRADVEAAEARLGLRFEDVDRRFEDVDRRFEDVDRRFDAVDARFDQLELRIDDRLERLRAELLAAFRGELVTAVAGQTRAVVIASVATALSVTGAVAALAQLL
jgi:chromatin segregation and condensation protein Rec8/ScpA/Scc1 (kleisin family)